MRLKMNIARISVMAVLVVLTACAQKGTPAPAANAPKPVATVNGDAVTSSEFEMFTKAVAGKVPAELTAAQRSQALDTLVRAEVVAQQAEKQGLDKQGDAPASLALARLQILEQAAMANFLKDHKVTDAELKAEYDAQVAAMPKTQYKARHILVKNKEEAEQIIAELKKGAKFEKLAADHSLDGSKNNGGDLDWFNPGNYPELEVVIKGMKDNDVSEPFRTRDGWHIVQLLGRRQFDNTDELKRRRAAEAIRESRLDEATELWMRRLRDEAYVEYKL